MRRLILLTVFLICSGCLAQNPTQEPVPLLTAVQAMPSQVKAGTFDHEAFSASLKQANADTNLDVPAICRLLAADIANSDVQRSSEQASTFAMVVLYNLLLRKSNTEEDRKLIASTLLTCVDQSRDQNRQNTCIQFVSNSALPTSGLMQFKEIAAKKIADGTAYSNLAIGLAHVAVRDQSVGADAVLAEFFRSPKVTDEAKTKAIFTLQTMRLSDQVLDVVAELLAKTKSDDLKVQIIDASYKMGSRALDREHDTLLALEANTDESQRVQQAAKGALLASPHSAVAGIH